MRLDIVIPALNEERAIESIIRRCLQARPNIINQTPVDQVTVTVVSDGSTDKTLELARAFEPEIKVIAFPVNRGYGAAISEGFAANQGELVAFLDADGTCDPEFFTPLVNHLLETKADVCLGSRMGPQSEMPRIRRVGNRIWRTLINLIARADISDAASGMRVIRRDSLERLEPLPTGLHYTPTMSCRAVLDGTLTIVEVPMPYKERVGPSKLSVIKDGMRFLKTIVDVSLAYQPVRVLVAPGLFLLLLGAVLLAPAAWHYLTTQQVHDWYIYRVLMATAFLVMGLQVFLMGLAADRAVDLIQIRQWRGGRLLAWFRHQATPAAFLTISLVLALIALGLNLRGLWQYLSTGHVTEHWSRAAVGLILLLAATQLVSAAMLEWVMRLIARSFHRRRQGASPDGK